MKELVYHTMLVMASLQVIHQTITWCRTITDKENTSQQAYMKPQMI